MYSQTKVVSSPRANEAFFKGNRKWNFHLTQFMLTGLLGMSLICIIGVWRSGHDRKGAANTP